MTDEQRVQIINLREAGNGYKKIGQLLGLSENTVKSFCQRRNLGGVIVQTAAEVSVCKCCGKAVPQTAGRKEVLLRPLPDEMVEQPSRPGAEKSKLRLHVSGVQKALYGLWKCEQEVLLP